MKKINEDGISFCPWCGIGIDHNEARYGKCANCENSWDPQEYLGRFEKKQERLNKAFDDANCLMDEFYDFEAIEEVSDLDNLDDKMEMCQRFRGNAKMLIDKLTELEEIIKEEEMQ